MKNNQFGPYSPIRKSGSFYFVSGQVGVDPATGKASDDIAQQTRQVLRNLSAVLESVGLRLDQVVKTTVFLADMSDFGAMNTVYESLFSAPRPARSTIAVKELPRVGDEAPLLVEIEAIAEHTT